MWCNICLYFKVKIENDQLMPYIMIRRYLPNPLFTFTFVLTLTALFWASTNSVQSQSIEDFPNNGIYTVPEGVTAVVVEIWGAGGGGGRGNGSTGGGGGGGGGYSKILLDVTEDNTITVRVGIGGTAGNPNGSNGGESYITFNGTTYRAYGGIGGLGADSGGTGGAGGVGMTTNGDNGSDGTTSGGRGGDSPDGGGIGGSGGVNWTDGSIGGTPGAGGGGGSYRANRVAGAGAGGHVRITPNVISYTTAGTYTYTVPDDVTQVYVQAWGAGGRGATRSGRNGTGGGGGGGAYAAGMLDVVPGETYQVIVGVGGNSNSSTRAASSSFNYNNPNSIVAEGGYNVANNTTNGGEGGSIAGSIGTIRFAGGHGANGIDSRSGGGGGAAGTEENGHNGSGTTGGPGGNYGGGSGGDGVTTNTNGNPGNAPGGGGSGARRTSSTRDGGAGADGQVIITPIITIGKPIFYTYRSGEWRDHTTWTTDPSGTTQVGNQIPDDNDLVVILDGRTVHLEQNIATSGLNITINPNGIIDMRNYTFTSPIQILRGQGGLRLSSTQFPTISSAPFLEAGGGTTEYYNSANFNLPTTQDMYNNLSINTSNDAMATQMHDLILNGNLVVKTGTYRINDNTNNARRELTIHGDVAVNSGAEITVGNGVTNSTTNPYNIDGGDSPFLNYYDQQSHRVVIYGNFTNNGTVRFTNLAYPIYNAFPPTTRSSTTGFATVYFRGATNSKVTCNGTTDFYNLVVDKGIDQSFNLTVYSTHYHNFRLFGANTAGGFNQGANPDLRKALWIRNGSLVLQGLTIIPSLTEGVCGDNATPNSDFYLPANGALVLDGSEVIVLSTADDYREVNLAYDVSAPNNTAMGIGQGGCSSFSILGKLQVNNGYFSTRESGGFITWDWASGQFIINGGIVDAKQYRAAAASGGGGGLASFSQTGGQLLLRGRFQRIPSAYSSIEHLKDFSTATLNTTRATEGALGGGVGTFNLNSASNVFTMSGGTITIYDVTGTGANQQKAFEVNSSVSNVNVSGGTIEIVPTTGSGSNAGNYYIETTAHLYNLIVNRASGNAQVTLRTNALKLLSNLDITSGVFNANGLDVSIGGNFTQTAAGSYVTGSNRTIFNGSGTQYLRIPASGTLNLHKLIVNKPKDTELRTNQDQTNTIQVEDSLRIFSGIINSYSHVLACSGHVENSGEHITTSVGYFNFNANVNQSVGGNGNGIFTNIRVESQANAGITYMELKDNIRINGTITFLNLTGATGPKRIRLAEFNMLLGENSVFIGRTPNHTITTSGNIGDGGITKIYSNHSPSFLFPLGVSNRLATIEFSQHPTTYGRITIVPVSVEHFATNPKGRSLRYFWRVKSEGFEGIAPGSVNHTYRYAVAELQTPTGTTENDYVPARFNTSTHQWSTGTTSQINKTTHEINWPQGVDYIDGDYTAGHNAFGNPTVFYSIRTGNWDQNATWSTVSHSGAQASRTPGAFDIVIVGNGHTVSLATHNTTINTGVQNCANLLIGEGGTLDIGYNPDCKFEVVSSHPNGNGLFRLTTSSTSESTFVFPSGDFSEFNVELGTTELYTTNPGAGTTYWLPQGVTQYGNLILSPLGGSNIIFANNDVLIFGDLTTRGQNADSWFLPTWNDRYPTNPRNVVSKTITIMGNMDIQGGSFGWYGGNRGGSQDVVVYGDIIVGENSGINVWVGNTSQSLSIGGSLYNYGLNRRESNVISCRSYVNFNAVSVTFFGDKSATVHTATNTDFTGRQGSTTYDQNNPAGALAYSATIFGDVTVNKGDSQATTLTFTGGTVSTPANNWLTLQNGTLRYRLTNPRRDFTVSTTTPFAIPGTAGLEVNLVSNNSNANTLIANSSRNDNDLYLDGKLTVANSTVYIGPINSPNNNNDIEYGGGGLSEIDVQNGGNLVVNGQIRMSPSSTAGVLQYRQSGNSTVVIKGQNANNVKPKLEVYNPGSVFEMTDNSSLYIIRGGGTTYGDLYVRPENSNVSGSSTIHFTQTPPTGLGTAVNVLQNYTLDADVPLNNLTINGTGSYNASVKLFISPLQLNGDLNISNARSTFDTNSEYSVNVSLKGDFINNGEYEFHSNHTTFNGNTQSILGSSTTNFFDLTVNPVTSVTMNRDVTVNNDLYLLSGRLLYDTHTLNLKGHFTNNANYDGDGNQGGIILNGTYIQEITGTGRFGRLELNNPTQARLNNSITLEGNLRLTNGVFNVNNYLLTLLTGCIIEGTNFGPNKMVSSDGVYSNVGIRKYFSSYSGSERTFLFPLGTHGKYTPVEMRYTSNTNVGYIRVNNINSNHPGVWDPDNVLHYFWDIESSGIAGFNGGFTFNYSENDVRITGSHSETDYIGAVLNIPGTSWSKITDAVDANARTIDFNFANVNSISGEYTAGIDDALPDNVPEYRNITDGHWENAGNWEQIGGDPYTLTGAPQGFIVTIKEGTEVTINDNYSQAYRTTIDGTLHIVPESFGNNLGSVLGNGTLKLESALIPAGRFTSFFNCANNSTLEYGGNSNYTIIADLYNTLPNLHFTGTGIRNLPNKDLTICKQLLIDGPTLNNYSNRGLNIQGTFERHSGAFQSGTGSAIVRFNGSNEQAIGGTLGNFIGTNAFNNFEINNAAGLTINAGGDIEVKGNLYLTLGNIITSSQPGEEASFTLSNYSQNSVFPAEGQANSFIDGPFTKNIAQGESFRFPVGKDGVLGNKVELSSTQSGSILWTMEFFTPNPTFPDFDNPLTYVNAQEYWTASPSIPGEAVVNISWDADSDLTPLMTEDGISDMRVAHFNDATQTWQEVNSTQSGANNNGKVLTSTRFAFTANNFNSFTTACINITKPRARLNPTGAICGDAGIPVVFSGVDYSNLNYELTYRIGGVLQSPIPVTSLPFTLPTQANGNTYQLTSFTYNNGNQLGVVDATVVTSYTVPTIADAGPDQSLCGATSAVLAGNIPAIGEGLWTIGSGDGGTVLTPDVNNSAFNGINGNNYSLTWTISNGGCTSSDNVVISFPFMPTTPEDFTHFQAEVCQGETDVFYAVENDESLTYTWNYFNGSGASIIGSGNSINIDYNASATSGIVSVYTTNGCGDSDPLERAVTVNETPVVELTVESPFDNICTGENTELTVTLANGSYLFDVEIFNGTITETFTEVTSPFTFTPHVDNVPIWVGPGPNNIYTYSIPIVTSDKGCSSVGQNSVEVYVWKIPETGPPYHIPNAHTP